MTKRVLGALAALVFSGSALACSSSSTPGGTTDTGVTPDVGGDTRTDAGRDTAPPPDVAVQYPKPGTVGKECASPEDCDPEGTAEDFAFCRALPAATPVCGLGSQTDDACDMGDGKTIPYCDGDRGLCSKFETDPSTCDPKCELNADGTWKQQCAGKNACNISLIGTGTDMKRVLIGTCENGCQADADCTGKAQGKALKCDTDLQYCLPGCTKDADCSILSVTSPLWKCDTTRSMCTFVFPKKLGEECTASEDCAICVKKTADAKGYCSRFCKTGGAATCGTGFSCTLDLRAKDDMGVDLVTFTTPPAGLNGICLKNCTADADCITGQVCVASAGTTQKTCQLAPTP